MQTQASSATVDPAPTVVWNSPHWQHPARRLAQPSVVLPCCSLYVPFWHARQVPASRMCPAPHTQYGDAESNALVEDARSLSHSLQPLARPGTALYLPVGQAAHAAISLPASSVVSYPASHRHAVFAVLLAGEYEFSGHAEHDALPGTDL